MEKVRLAASQSAFYWFAPQRRDTEAAAVLLFPSSTHFHSGLRKRPQNRIVQAPKAGSYVNVPNSPAQKFAVWRSPMVLLTWLDEARYGYLV